MNPRDVKARLLGHQALLSGHFQLSSGKHSNRYLQCAVALQHPDTAAELGGALARRVRGRLGSSPHVVVSPAMGGLIIGHETGRALGTRACFTERIDGKMVLRRGFHLQPGERVLLVEDVVTTGLSSRETLEVIRAGGGKPVAVGCIANRSQGSEVDGLPLLSLLDLDVEAWKPERCPLCADSGGAGPAIKPGSRIV